MALANTILAVLLCGFTLWEVNYPTLRPLSALALFGLLGMTLCYLNFPMAKRWKTQRWSRALDIGLAVLVVAGCGYVIVQTEPLFGQWWIGAQSLGNRPGQESQLDIAVGILLCVLVFEATRRCMGWALPLLGAAFLAYALLGPQMPEWLMPHRGYSLERTIAQTVLHSQGVFGVALDVMFRYVFLFVVFGALLSATGATEFIIEFARRLFRHSHGGPAKVAVVSSGLMGSLSGSAVANVVTTGTFTIPMMRASGFSPTLAGGIEAAASSGGALMPPVMGAAAYLMLEIVQPPITYLEVIKSALIPAILYYLSLFLFVHFHSCKLAHEGRLTAGSSGAAPDAGAVRLEPFKGILFGVALVSLVAFLALGMTPFRAVTWVLLEVLILSYFRPETRLNWRRLLEAAVQSGRDAVPLVCAAACVGVIIGVVTLTGVGTKFPSLILPYAESNLFGALVMIMIGSLVLGMGLPSAVCYLLMATLVGPVLGKLGVPPLAAHMFIFYFGMMSMVTPPVALAAYAASSIAGSKILATSMAAFRVSLVGFTLPFMFVFRPELLLLAPAGQALSIPATVYAVLVAVFGVLALAAGLSGYLFGPLRWAGRSLILVAAALMLYPAKSLVLTHAFISDHDLLGIALLAVVAVVNWRAKSHNGPHGCDPADRANGQRQDTAGQLAGQ